MGLLLDLSPDGGMDDDGNDEELEAELLSLMGGGGGRSQGKKGEGRGENDKTFHFLHFHSLSRSFSLSHPYATVIHLLVICSVPVPMTEIERMAALCMKDLDTEDIGDEDLDDEDLLVTHTHTLFMPARAEKIVD